MMIMMNICLLLIINLVFVRSELILPEYENCNGALGMESGSITDDDLTSSSSHDISSVGPQMARIRTELEGGAWCPEKPIGVNSYEYLQIEFRQLFFVNAIETQGRFGNGQGREYAEYYQIQYQRDNKSTDWITYSDKLTNKTILNGNINTYLAEKRFLSTPILAKRIRIIPHSLRWRTVCMRVEVYGCPFYGGVIAYKTSPTTDKDNTYDGGVGKLVDGTVSDCDHCWLGWNESPVSVEFDFDVSRNFKAINIFTMNEKYHLTQIEFDDNVTIKHRTSPKPVPSSSVFIDKIDLSSYGKMLLAKKIRIRFEFSSELFLLTEVTFDNEIVSDQLMNILSSNNETTSCPTVKMNNVTLESSSLVFFTFEWLTITVVLTFTFALILLAIIGYCHRRQRRRSSHRRLRQNSQLYYKSSQMTTTTSGSCASTSSEHDGSTLPNQKINTHLLLSNNYDDFHSEQQSMGSYIYPITSTSSLLQTTPPGSLFKGEQYAVIDGNYSTNFYRQWPATNTFHYASLDIGQVNPVVYRPNISLFNCILPKETGSSTSSSIHSAAKVPNEVDQSKLMALRKLSETVNGEIYLGNYLVNNHSQPVLIKAVKANLIDSSREQFQNELNVLLRLNHSNVATIHAVQYDLLYFVQEYSHYGTLQDYYRQNFNHSPSIDPNFQKMNIFFAYQLANALQYLSHSKIFHGDVATRNILFYSDYTIKLTDCAIAFVQYQHEYWSNDHGHVIPLRWIAPEALANNPTLHSDIYSFAVTLWEIWSRCSSLPYGSLTNEEVYQRLIVQTPSFNFEPTTDCVLHLCVPPDCPKEIYDLMCECWQREATKRPTIDDICLYFRRHIDSSRVNTVS